MLNFSWNFLFAWIRSEGGMPLVCFAGAYAITLAMTPWIIRFAIRREIVATSDLRRRHEKVTPLLGGVGIYVSLILVCICPLFFEGRAPASVHGSISAALWFAVPLTIVFFLGFWDDWKHLTAHPKFLFQSVASVIFLVGKYPALSDIGLPHFLIPIIALGLVLLMVGIMNAVNLIDGMDGLCSGTSAIIASFAGAMALYMGHKSLMFSGLVPAMIGALLGFLYYNRRPARIFLGDTGSLTIGFFLAAICVELVLLQRSIPGLIASLILVGHPIIDTLLVMILRKRAGRSMFSGDRNHLHHRLQRLGLNPDRAVQLLWLASTYLGIQSILLLTTSPATQFFVIFSLGLFVVGAVLGLRFIERSLSTQMTRFGQAWLGSLVPAYMSPTQFNELAQSKLKEIGTTSSSLSLLVIDYLKIMPQLLHESPDRIDEFFRRSHEVVRSNIRSNTIVARLSDTLTVIFLEDAEGSVDTGNIVARRISQKLHDIQQYFQVTMSDASLAEGILLISHPREIHDLCRRVDLEWGQTYPCVRHHSEESSLTSA